MSAPPEDGAADVSSTLHPFDSVHRVSFPTMDTNACGHLPTPNLLPIQRYSPKMESIIPPDIDTIDLSSDALLEGDGAASAHDSTELPGSIRFPSQPGKPNKLAVIMVGLPLRGKTFISLRLCRYLIWLGNKTRVFVVNDYCRKLMDQKERDFGGQSEPEVAALSALDDMIEWLSGEGQVAIFDDLNVTRSQRAHLMDTCHQQQFQVVFVECVCHDEELIKSHQAMYTATCPDNVAPDQVIETLNGRIKQYEQIYEPLGEQDKELSYIRVTDGSRQLCINKFGGYLPGRIVALLMNVHSEPRHIYLSRHGLSEYNTEGRIGGDSNITDEGTRYARALANYMKNEVGKHGQLGVWTSTLRRTKQTAQFIQRHKIEWRALDEIHAGVCDSLTHDEIQERYPEVLEARRLDKFTFRYPEGESYIDVIQRLEPIFIGMERQRCPLLVVAHQAILRVLACYFTDQPLRECPTYPIPLHGVLKLTPHAYGTHCEVIDLSSDANHGPLPQSSGCSAGC